MENIKTTRELKALVATSRQQITEINGVQFTELYPLLKVTNRFAWYYDPAKQGNVFLFAPYTVQMGDVCGEGGRK